MKILKPTTKEEVESAIKEAAEVLSQGGLIIYPTDTIYGIGADATNNEAIEKVYELKKRSEKKPLSIVVSDIKMAERYVELNELAEGLAERMLPGPLTLILKSKGELPENINDGGDKIGIRIPDSYFCLALGKAFGKPYTTTSANISGGEARGVAEILQQLKEGEHLIDLVIDVGDASGEPSTILDISEGNVEVLREGVKNNQAIVMVTKTGEEEL